MYTYKLKTGEDGILDFTVQTQAGDDVVTALMRLNPSEPGHELIFNKLNTEEDKLRLVQFISENPNTVFLRFAEMSVEQYTSYMMTNYPDLFTPQQEGE